MDRRERNCGTLNARRKPGMRGKEERTLTTFRKRKPPGAMRGRKKELGTTFRKRKPPGAMRGRKKELGQPSGKGSRLGQ